MNRLFTYLLLLVSLYGYGANSTWTNAGGDNLWSNAANWSGGKPGSNDNAIFDGATSTADVIIDENVAVRGWEIQSDYSGTISINAGLTVRFGRNDFSMANGTVNLNDATFRNNANGTGTFTQTGGTFNAENATLIFTNQQVTLSGGTFNLNQAHFDQGDHFTISGGTFNGQTGRLEINRTFTLTSGIFNAPTQVSFSGNVTANSGGFNASTATVTFDASGNRNWDFNVKDTVYNLVIDANNNNRAIRLQTNDTLVVLNTLRGLNGEIDNQHTLLLDSVIFSSGWDGGSSTFLFGGNENSVLVIENTNSERSYVVMKDSNTDTLFITRSGGTELDFEFNDLTLETGITHLDPSITFDFDGNNIYNNGGKLFIDGTIMRFDGNYSANGGKVVNSTGTFEADASGNRNYDFATRDTLFNFTVNMNDNHDVNLQADDSLYIRNKLLGNNGEIRIGQVIVLDSVELASTFDGGTAELRFRGNGNNTHLVQGNWDESDIYIEKPNPLDEVQVLSNNPTITFSGNNRGVFVESGKLTFPQNKKVVLQNTFLYLYPGGTYVATSDTTVFEGQWDNSAGGSFDANNGVFTFTHTNNARRYISSVHDTFHIVFADMDDSRSLTIETDDTLVVKQKLTCLNGRFLGGPLVILDTLEVKPGWDDGNATVHFKGAENSTYLAEANWSGNDMFFNKQSINDTISIIDPSGPLSLGNLGDDFSIIRGSVDFPENAVVNLNYGNINLTPNTRLIATSGTTTLDGSWNNTGGEFKANGGTWELNHTNNARGYTSVSIDTFFNFNINGNDGRNYVVTNGDTFAVAGTLTLTDGEFQNGAIVVLGDVSVESTYDDGSTAMVLKGNQTNNVDFKRSLENSSWYIEKDNASDSVIFSNTASLETETGGNNETLEISNGILAFGTVDADLNFRYMNLSNGGKLAIPSRDLYFSGSITNNGGKFISDGGEFIFDATNNGQSYTTSSKDTLQNLTVDHNDTRNFTITSGDTLFVSNNLTFSNGRMQNGSLVALGNVTVQSTYDGGSATLLFRGTTNSTFDPISPTTYDGAIAIEKASGAKVTLSSPLTIESGQGFFLTSGILEATTANMLTFQNNANYSGGSDASYVDGPVTKIGNDAFDFPIGKDGYFAPISITNPNGGGDSFTAEYFRDNPNNAGYATNSLGSGINNISICDYWELDRNSGTSSENVTLDFGDDQSCGIQVIDDLVVCKWDGSQWIQLGGSASGDTTNGDVQGTTAIGTFSPFALGSTSPSNPLPVELVGFSGIQIGNATALTWTTASEINSSHFNVLRSSNGVDFEKIGIVASQGTSNQFHEYEFIDTAPLPERNYYRLEQVDLDGALDYSERILVYFTPSVASEQDLFMLFPNPANDVVNLNFNSENSLPENTTFTLLDQFGKVIRQQSISSTNNSISLLGLPKGLYYIRVTLFQKVETRKLIRY